MSRINTPHGRIDPTLEAAEPKYRLITRADFDGLASAVLLNELGIVRSVKFAEPKEMQDGLIPTNELDLIANLPWRPGVHMVFDHHVSEMKRVGEGEADNRVIDPEAPSAARVIYDYFGGQARFGNFFEEMMDGVDAVDGALFHYQDVLEPEGWIMLGFLLDERSGLERIGKFRTPRYNMMIQLVEAFSSKSVDAILKHPAIRERHNLYMRHTTAQKEQIRRCARMFQTAEGNDHLVMVDLHEEDVVYAGNRFMVYALYPTAKISVTITWDNAREKIVFVVGRSIFDRSANTNIGELMLEYGGGGHAGAGTCRVPFEDARRVGSEIAKRILADG